MEIVKKVNIGFIFFLTFGYIFFYSFARPFLISNDFFSIPFRIVFFFFSLYILYLNFENVKRRKSTVFCIALFWIFYLCKAVHSFRNDFFLSKIISDEYQIYTRILGLNLIPYIAVLSINFSKEIAVRLNGIIFNFLWVVLGISCLYTIIVYRAFEKSSGIFASSYINVGHYGLSLLIISLYYYFQSSEGKIKPVLGIFIGIFTIFSSSARSPILAAFIIVLVLFCYINKLKYWIALFFSILIFMIGIYLLKQTSVSDFEFVERMYNALFQGNGSGRSLFLLKGWNVFKENIFLGGRILFEDGMYPHNIIVEILMSMGIVGVGLFLLYYRDLWKFKIKYLRENIYYLPFFLFFIQYCVLVLTSGNIFGNMEFWSFSAVTISIILFCYDEEIKSNDSRGNTTGNH